MNARKLGAVCAYIAQNIVFVCGGVKLYISEQNSNIGWLRGCCPSDGNAFHVLTEKYPKIDRRRV